MHINYNDPVLWLSYRFACDAKARNQNIEKKFLDFFKHHNHQLHLADVGAGTGANFRYYFDKIPQNQEWVFIEQDPRMIKATLHCLEKFAQDRDYRLQQNHDTLTISHQDKTAHIKLLQGTLDRIEHLADLQKVDVVTANAFFDLISYDQFEIFTRKLSENEVCLLATLNYYETSFLPFSECDHRFLRFYHMHMKRPQSFGIAMGRDCSEEMLDLLRQHHMLIEQEASQWHISRSNTAMHHFLLNFMEKAIHELNLVPEEQHDFNNWMAEKKKLCHDRLLEINVDHSDIFAYPD